MVVAQPPLETQLTLQRSMFLRCFIPDAGRQSLLPCLALKAFRKTRSTKLERRVKMEIIHNAFGSST